MSENKEGKAFLTDDVVKVEIQSSKESKNSDKGRWCNVKRCAIITGVVVVLVVAVILIGGYLHYKLKYSGDAQSVDGSEIRKYLDEDLNEDQDDLDENKLDLISGSYKLKQYDENYRDYLLALGTPSFVIDLIISYNDIFIFKASKRPNGYWSWKLIGSDVKEYAFRMGELFEVVFGSRKKIYMNKICEQPAPNKIKCVVTNEERQWNIEETLTFTHDDKLVQELVFHKSEGEDIKTVRLFNKKTIEELEEERKAENADSPFSTSDEDFGDFDDF